MTKRPDRAYSPFWRRFTTTALPPMIRALMKRDWHGHEHIPAEGGVIVAANHLSYADWAAVALFTYEGGRYPAFLIKSPVFSVKVLGAFLRACGQLPVYRGQADAALVLKDAERALQREECLIFYPEGTASRDPEKWPMVARTGVARLALATGVPVIPVAHWGAQDILPYGSSKPRLVPRHMVRMLAGPPVDLSAFAGKPLTREVLQEATSAVMADITALLTQLRDGTPPEVPFDMAAARRAARADPTPPQAPGQPGEDAAAGGESAAGEKGAGQGGTAGGAGDGTAGGDAGGASRGAMPA